MNGFLLSTDDLLRGRLDADGRAGRVRAALPRLLTTIILFGLFYGAVMGTFGVGRGRLMQLVYSSVKVPMLLLVTFLLSLPSFFVLNTLLGVRNDFGRVLRALVAAQAGITIVLASLAPFTAFWYVSFRDYDLALLFNGMMFAIATLAGQAMLRRSYRPLIAGNARHRTLIRIWVLIYTFVAIQMAWVMRPFLGSPRLPTTFLRAGAWGNAYIELLDLVQRALRS